MFENILGQDRLIGQLRSEISGGQLPGAVLFYGEPYTGKLSTALELSRVLTCGEQGAWSCNCPSCRQNRVLDHPYILMLGSRYFVEEIAASGDALVRSRSTGGRYLFLRAVRKLTRRFDPILWEGNEQKLNKIESTVSKLEGELELLYPEKELPEKPVLKKSVEIVTAQAMELVKVLPRDNIPIDQVRAINTWVHTTSSSSSKVIIFENADKMGASSRNALLKTLEEPPPETHFVLLSGRKGRIMPTILSRVRQYHFPDRDAEGSAEVLKKIFRTENTEYPDLNSFFLAWKGVPLKKLNAQALHFFSYVWGNAEWEPEKLEEFLKDKNLSIYFVPFLQAVSTILHGYMKSGGEGRGIAYPLLERWNGEIRDALLRFEQYNQAPDLLLEALLYSMKESV